MASSVTVTKIDHTAASIRRYECDWLSHTDGTINNKLQDADGNDINFDGVLMRVTFVPDAGGTQPSDLYDLTLTDDYSMDVLAGQGSNLSQTASTDVSPAITCTDGTYSAPVPFTIHGELTLVGAACGNAKGGKVILYFS